MSDMRVGADGTSAVPAVEIAGFWRRIFALFIDVLLLAIVGFAIGTVDFRDVVALGVKGRLIGAGIALAYFGFPESRWGGGASLGQRTLGLRVVRRDGKTIGLFRAALRTIVFWTPYYLNNLALSSRLIPGLPNDSRIDTAVGIVQGFIVFGGMLSIVYLYVFNTRTRQSLHDLVAGTFVVRAQEDTEPVAARIWRGHLAAIAVILVVCAVAPIALYGFLSNSSLAATYGKLSAIQSAVLAYPGVETASVQTSVYESWATNTQAVRTTSLIVAVRSRAVPRSMEDAENDIAAIVLRNDPAIMGDQYLTVRVAFGYDLGIFSWTNSEGWSGTPQQWQQRIAPHGGATVQS